MKNLSRQLSILAMTVTIAGLAVAQSGNDVTTLTKISGYRQWTKVNAEPVKVEIPLKIDPALVAS